MKLGIFSLAAMIVAVGTLVADDKKMDMNAMQAAMMKHAAVGEHHKVFEKMVGSWNYTGKMWMDPSKPPQELSGKSECKVIMEGRFAIEQCKSTDPKMPFEGTCCTGYDNHKKKYVFSWIDNWSTGIMNGEGTMDKAGKMTSEGECYCPMINGPRKMKIVCEIRADGSIHKEFFSYMDGKEMKGMEMTYTKAK